MNDLRPYINSLCEPGGSHAHGAWADGHHDVASFMIAVRDEYKRPISSTDVHHGYYRVVRGVAHMTTGKWRGAKPITWAQW